MIAYITPILIVLILLLVLVVFIPALLDLVSRRNRAQRDLLKSEIKRMEREARRFERQVAPYRRLRSAAYKMAAKSTEEQISLLNAVITNTQHLAELIRCPAVYGYLLPAQHFLTHPGHIRDIITDSRLIRKAMSELAKSARYAESVGKALDALALLPEQLADEKKALGERQSEVHSIINRERAEGIEALDDFSRDIGVVNRYLDKWEQVAGTGDINALDEGAIALEAAGATLTDTFSRASLLERERVALDRRIRRITSELDDAQATLKSGPAVEESLSQVRPLLRRAAWLLNESALEHRRRREFNAAGADVSTAAQLVTMGRDLIMADRQIRVLTERDDGVSLTEAISAIGRDLNDVLAQMAPGSDAIQEVMFDTSLSGRVAQVRTRAETLGKQQDEVIAKLSREALLANEELDRTWERGQRLLPLADDDPLARRYARLHTQFEDAKRQPSALEQFRRDIGMFEQAWTPWVSRVEDTRERIVRLRSTLPDLIDRALEIAEPWNCLAEDVTQIQQRAADFETIQAKFSSATHRREAEAQMDQLESIEREIDERFAKIKEKSGRLQFLESDVAQIIALATDNKGEVAEDHPDKAKWERTIRLIDHHTRSAHAANNYEDASVALLRAADVANKLAM